MPDPKHIKALKERVDRRRQEREQDEAMKALYAEREKEIAAAPLFKPMDFWCDDCQCDFTTRARKRMRMVYDFDARVSYPDWPPYAWYEAQCPKGHRATRNITNKHLDQYFNRSEMLRRERILHADDLLQPSDPRFAKVYPEAWKKLQGEQEPRL